MDAARRAVRRVVSGRLRLVSSERELLTARSWKRASARTRGVNSSLRLSSRVELTAQPSSRVLPETVVLRSFPKLTSSA